MPNPEILYLGSSLRQNLMGIYSNRGPEFGLRVARQYGFDVVRTVCEVNGRQEALKMLLTAQDAMLNSLPMPDLVFGPGETVALVAPAAAKPVPKRGFSWPRAARAGAFMLVGFMWHQPIMAVLGWAFGW